MDCDKEKNSFDYGNEFFRGNVFRDRRYRYFEFSRSLLLSYSLYVGLLVDEGEDYYGVYFVYDMIGRLFYGFLVFR